MKLFTKAQERQLLENGRKNAERIAKDGNTIDFKPVIKLFCPWGAATWLLTELDPEEPTIVLCSQSLDRRRLEFSGYIALAGSGVPSRRINDIGTFCPIAPCGRCSL